MGEFILFAKTRPTERKFTSRSRLFSSWFSILLAIAIVWGVGLRFVNLEKKIYWHDEVYTSLRMTGHTMGEVKEQMFVGKVVNVKALLKYQQFDRHSSLQKSLDSMALEDAHHSPLYFILLRFWAQIFGNNVGNIRLFSVFISLSLFPAVYWLCKELFVEKTVSWMAIALIAISPIDLWLAQDAREYGLWMVTIAVASAAFLRALRLKTKSSWSLYAFTLIIGYYSYILTGLVAIAHSIYLLILQRCRWNQTTKAFAIASSIGAIAILPWMAIIIKNFQAISMATAWLKNSLPLPIAIQIWLLNASRLFLDFDLKLEHFWAYCLVIPIVILEIYGFYWLCRRNPAKVSLFILTLAVTTALYTILPDLIRGGQRSIVTRYLMPCYLSMQLAVAYLLATKISSLWQIEQKIWRVIAGMVLTIGIASSTVHSQAVTWWHRDVSYHNTAIANTVNQKARPLIISDAFGVNLGNLISLGYSLNPKVQYLLLPEVGKNPQIPNIPKGFSDIFIFNIPESYRDRFQQKHGGKFVPAIGDLWQYQKVGNGQ
jgi:uncharacterized membrane protein